MLEAFVCRHRSWLQRKQAERQALSASAVSKQYLSGEGFAYLGRSYRLLLVDEQAEPLKLQAGHFRLRRSEAENGRTHFVRWYAAHALPWMTRRVELLAPRVGAHPTELIVRDLGHRWGSCTYATGRIRMHWATMLPPASVIEYVIVHELVHLRVPNHSPAFWRDVERVLPDYRQRRRWLAQHGAGVNTL